MKKLIYTIAFAAASLAGKAQIADGSTAPDFTFTDVNGIPHNLYSILDSGKIVAIDASATWCGPCWSYHTAGYFDQLYDMHDVPGDNSWRVFLMEVDGSTNSADLHGTGSSTQGDWVTGTHHPIIDPPSGSALSSFNSGYAVPWYPSFFFICPNKKVYTDTLNNYTMYPWPPMPATFEWLGNNKCVTTGIDNVNDPNPVTIAPNPATTDVTFYFNLNHAQDVSLQISNMTGQLITSKNFGKLNAGDQSLHYHLQDLAPGMYLFTLSANGRKVVKKVAVQ